MELNVLPVVLALVNLCRTTAQSFELNWRDLHSHPPVYLGKTDVMCDIQTFCTCNLLSLSRTHAGAKAACSVVNLWRLEQCEQSTFHRFVLLVSNRRLIMKRQRKFTSEFIKGTLLPRPEERLE